MACSVDIMVDYTAAVLLNLDTAESHSFTGLLGRKLACVGYNGLVPMNCFEVLCWPCRRRM